MLSQRSPPPPLPLRIPSITPLFSKTRESFFWSRVTRRNVSLFFWGPSLLSVPFPCISWRSAQCFLLDFPIILFFLFFRGLFFFPPSFSPSFFPFSRAERPKTFFPSYAGHTRPAPPRRLFFSLPPILDAYNGVQSPFLFAKGGGIVEDLSKRRAHFPQYGRKDGLNLFSRGC